MPTEREAATKRKSTSRSQKDKPSSSQDENKLSMCIVCSKVAKCRYNIERKNAEMCYLCSDECFKKFKQNPNAYLKSLARSQFLSNHCEVCEKNQILTPLTWHRRIFCSEKCLTTFQGEHLNLSCEHCSKPLPSDKPDRWTLLSEQKVLSFCEKTCYDEFRLKHHVCMFCAKQVVMSDPISNQLKDENALSDTIDLKTFCSSECFNDYEADVAKKATSAIETEGQYRTRASRGLIACFECHRIQQPRVEYYWEEQKQRFCTEDCFAAFAETNKLKLIACCQCGRVVDADDESLSFEHHEGRQRMFCSPPCRVTYRAMQSDEKDCEWCSDKCSSINAIEQRESLSSTMISGNSTSNAAPYRIYCSALCLRLRDTISCELCGKVARTQCELNVEGIMKSFCSIICLNSYKTRMNADMRKRSRRSGLIGSTISHLASGSVGSETSPLVQPVRNPNLHSFAEHSNPIPRLDGVNVHPSHLLGRVALQLSYDQSSHDNLSPMTLGVNRLNQGCQTKPILNHKSVTAFPDRKSLQVQTDQGWARKNHILPVPVPIFVPVPMPLYNIPFPRFVPIPMPIPVPVFVPLTPKGFLNVTDDVQLAEDRTPGSQAEEDVVRLAEALANSLGEEKLLSENTLRLDRPSATTQTDPLLPNVGHTAMLYNPASTVAPNWDEQAVAAMQHYTPAGAQQAQSVPPIAVGHHHFPTGDEQSAHHASNAQAMQQFNGHLIPQHLAHDDAYYYLNVQNSVAVSAGGHSMDAPQWVATSISAQMPSPHMHHSMMSASASTSLPPADSLVQQMNGDRQSTALQSMARQDVGVKQTASREDQTAVTIDCHRTLSGTTQQQQAQSFDLNVELCLQAWYNWRSRHAATPTNAISDIASLSPQQLAVQLYMFVKDASQPGPDNYDPDSVYYLILGLQVHLNQHSNRFVDLFNEPVFHQFSAALDALTEQYQPQWSSENELVCRIEEENLWESKQLGTHSPYALFFSLVYLVTKHMTLSQAEQHRQLTLSNVTHTTVVKKISASDDTADNGQHDDDQGTTALIPVLQFIPPRCGGQPKVIEGSGERSNRCPLHIFQKYLSKCPKRPSIDPLYMSPRPDWQPDDDIWFDAMKPVTSASLSASLSRVRMVREIQESLYMAGALLISSDGNSAQCGAQQACSTGPGPSEGGMKADDGIMHGEDMEMVTQ